MISLLQKDWRINRVPVVASLIVLICPYLLVAIELVVMAYRHRPWERNELVAWLNDTSVIDIGLLIILASAYGGIAFAQERRERSADFLAMLSTSRVKILGSKALIAAACIAVPIAINMTFLIGSENWPNHWIYFWQKVCTVSGATTMVFGLGWLCSSFLSSATISAAIAIGISGALALGFYEFCDMQQIPHVVQVALLIACTFSIGIVCLLAGSIYWLRRIEP